MATINKRILINAGMGAVMLGLLVWNMQQCDSINKEHDVNRDQNKKLAKVDTVISNHASHINNLIDAIGRVDKKADDNARRIRDLDDRLSEVTDSVDSLRVRVDSIKPCPCADKKNDVPVPATPRKSKKANKYNSARASVAQKGNGASATNVTAVQQNGNNNTVNVNTGTVNNYYSATPAASAPESVSQKREIECIGASATIETVHTVVVTRTKSR